MFFLYFTFSSWCLTVINHQAVSALHNSFGDAWDLKINMSVTHMHSPADVVYGCMIDSVSSLSKDFSKTYLLVQNQHNDYNCCFTITSDIKSAARFTWGTHGENEWHQVGVKVYSLIKLPYFIKLASAETLGQITHTLFNFYFTLICAQQLTQLTFSLYHTPPPSASSTPLH